MNKNELVKAVAREAGLTQAEALSAVDATLNTIMRTLADGEEVLISRFGTFRYIPADGSTTRRRNPQTGEYRDIPNVARARFHIYPEFARAVKEGDTSVVVKKDPKS